MADTVFRGDAPAVAQLDTITIGGTWATSDTATVTINGKAVTFTVGGSTTIADVVAGLVALLQASDLAEFEEITWVDASPDITGTAVTAGKPFTLAVSKSSASGTISNASTTANGGPSVLSANNVTGGVLPGAADTLTLEENTVDLLYGLTVLSGTLAAVDIEASYTGKIGLPRQASGSPNYAEYRDREFTVDVTALTIGQGDGAGSSRMLINLGSVQSTVRVFKTASSSSGGLHALQIRGTNASNVLQVQGSSTVDVAPESGQAATFATINATGSAKVRLSERVTWTTINASGSATVEIYSDTSLTDWTTINISGSAKVILYGDNGGTTVTITGTGRFDDRGEGTIASLVKGPTAAYTTEESGVAAGARVFTNTTLSPGAGVFNDEAKKCTFSNAIDLGAGGLTNFPNLNLGNNINLQRS